MMKKIRFTRHALEQCQERGTNEAEITEAIKSGTREPAKSGRQLCRFNFEFGKHWQGSHYAIKQVAPVIKEEADEISCDYSLHFLFLNERAI